MTNTRSRSRSRSDRELDTRRDPFETGSGSAGDTRYDGNPQADGVAMARPDANSHAARLNRNTAEIAVLRARLNSGESDDRAKSEARIRELQADSAAQRVLIAQQVPARRHAAKMRKLGEHVALRAKVFAGHESDLATNDEVKLLKAIQARCDALLSDLDALSYDKPGAQRRSAIAAFSNAQTAENLTAVHAAVSDSRAEQRARIKRQRQPIAAAIRELCEQSRPLLGTIQERAAAFCEAESARLVLEETALASRYGVPHEHGPLHGALYRLAQQLRMPGFHVNNRGPRANLAGLVNL